MRKSILIITLVSIFFWICNDLKDKVGIINLAKSDHVAIAKLGIEVGEIGFKRNLKSESIKLDTIEFKANRQDQIWGKEYVTAESGLLCREKPNGKVIHKFPYGTEIEIIEITDIVLTIVDEGKEISGNWVKVKIGNSNKTGYVFDGFLKPNAMFDLDVEKIARLTPATFIISENKKGLILQGTHQVYDRNLNSIREITINSISDVTILSATKFERPRTRAEAKRTIWQDYCKWANYVEIIYQNEKLIVFGAEVLQIENNTDYQFNNRTINFILANSFLKKTGTATEELSGCDCGSDFLIKSDDNYSFVFDHTSKENYLFFFQNEYGSEGISHTMIKNDTIFTKVEQGFQEGTGAYKLKIFKDNGWKFIGYDVVRDYGQN